MTNKKKVAIEQSLDENLALIALSYLTSASTSCLRASSKCCLELFVLNCPPSTNNDIEMFECIERPEHLECEFLEECPHANPLSPLRCWSFRLKEVCDRLKTIGTGPRISILPLMSDARKFARNRKFVMAAITKQNWPNVLAHVPDHFKRDRRLVIAAVRTNGNALVYADKRLRADKEVALLAVAQNGLLIYLVRGSAKRDCDVISAARDRRPPPW